MMKNLIKELRLENGLKQEQVAAAIGTSNTNLSRYERNLVEPNADIRKKLADYFNVSVPYLLGYDDIEAPNDLSFVSKRKAINCIRMLMKILNISKEDLERSIKDEKQN